MGKLLELKNRVVELKCKTQQDLDRVKEIPEGKRQDSTLWINQGEITALEIVLNMIKELEEEN